MPHAYQSFFSSLWSRFGEDKSMNFAKALAELVAEKLAIPIGNSKRIAEVRQLVERVFGKQLADAGGDGLTILAKMFIHMPQRWNQYIAAFTGFSVDEVTVVMNQFLDELAKGIIKHNGKNPDASIASTVETAKAALAQTASEAPVVEQLSTMERLMQQPFIIDIDTGLIHTHNCPLIFDHIREKDGGKGGGNQQDKNKAPQFKQVIKPVMREVTLAQILQQGRDPLKKCDRCCVQVVLPPIKTTPSATGLVECAQSLEDVFRRPILTGISRISFAKATLDKLDVAEFMDYVQRPMWTKTNAKLMVEMWMPADHATAAACLTGALSAMQYFGAPKERPKPPTPSKLDKVADAIGTAMLQYAKGDESPLINATHQRVMQIETGLRKRGADYKASANYGARLLRQGK